jgi:hypothetical protein
VSVPRRNRLKARMAICFGKAGISEMKAFEIGEQKPLETIR